MKQEVWADGLSIQCLAETLGLVIVIFKQSEDRWDRFTFAPGFKQDVAMSRHNAPPVVLTLNKKHFEAVHAPQKTKFPRPWLLKTTKPLMIDLTGAGRGLPSLSATPSIHTWRTPVSSISRRSSIPHPVQKSIRKVKVGSSVDQPMAGTHVVHSQSCMSHAPDRRHNASKRRSSVARSSSARVSLTVARTDAAPSSCAHQQTHCDAVFSVEVPLAHDAVQHAGRHSEPLVQARDTARAKRNTRDRLGPKFKAIASIQAKQAGTGLHVHPGSLGSAGGFPFVCVRCNKKVSYPTDSCCPNNMPSKSRDVSKQGRRVVWKAILAKANKQAAAAKLCTVKEQRAQRAEANRLQRQDREREAIDVQASKPDPLGSLPVFPKSQGGVWWKCPWCDFAIQSTVQRVSKSRLKNGTLKGFMPLKIPKCRQATCLNTRPDF